LVAAFNPVSSFCQLLDFGRRLQILDHLATGFARQPHHKIPYEDSSEDMAGKAIPEVVIAQLDAATDLIGIGLAYGKFPPEVVQAMMRTIYVLLRDTGAQALGGALAAHRLPGAGRQRVRADLG
jgi:hypothetical protein